MRQIASEHATGLGDLKQRLVAGDWGPERNVRIELGRQVGALLGHARVGSSNEKRLGAGTVLFDGQSSALGRSVLRSTV